MIDRKYFRNHLEEVKENCKRRKVNLDVDKIWELDQKILALQQEVQQIQRRRNEIAKKMKTPLEEEERKALREEAKALKEQESQKKQEWKEKEAEFYQLYLQIPNLTHPEVPLGESDEDNRELRRWGTPRQFDFPPLDHVELGEKQGWLDFSRAAKVTGSKFYYLIGDLVLLEWALVRFAFDLLLQEGFELYITPDLARTEIVEGIGFQPRGEETQIYRLEKFDLCLIGTAEITLGGYFADMILEKEELPKFLCGLSHCFRTEAGAHGKAAKGLYRVHQFTKVEMFAFTLPEESEKIHEWFLSLEEKIYQSLEIPYRVVDVCTAELGNPAYRKFDIEAWMPGRGEKGAYGEITSTSNCTDYQARRLNIRFRREKKSKPEFVHMLNGTAIAVSRTIIAILENFQQKDGTVRLPKVLHPYVGKEVLGKPIRSV